MNVQNVFDKIDALNPQDTRIWEEVCNMESPTDDKARVDAVGNYFLKMAEKQGWEIEVEEYAQAGNVICITMNPQAKAAPVCISGHIDTVHPVGLFGQPPVTKDAEKIYGPGVKDCKGGVVAGFLAMDAMAQCGFTDRPVKMIIQTDEETDSRQSQKKSVEFICRKAKDAVAFLNTEGGRGQTAVLIRKGILRYRLVISGVSAHASRCPEGASAIAEAAHKLLELEKMKDMDARTCNVGVIQGGTVGNTVPDRCSFLVDIRFGNQENCKRAEEIVQKTAQRVYVPGCSCVLEKISVRPAMPLCDANRRLLERMNEIYKESGLPQLTMRAEPSGSDAAYTTLAGIPTVDNVGVEGGRIHSPEEFAYLRSLAEAAKRYAAVAICI